MALFGSETIRLLRTKWGTNAQLLAEELYSIFNGHLPMTIDAPVTFNPPTNKDGTTVKNATPVIFNTDVTNNGAVTNNGPVTNTGPFTFESPKTNVKDANGNTEPLDDHIRNVSGGAGNSILFGYIVSGSGDQYQVDVSVSSTTLRNIKVNFPNLNSSELIDVGQFIMPIGSTVQGGSIRYYANPPAPLVYYGVVAGGSGSSPVCTIFTLGGTSIGSSVVSVIGSPSGNLPNGSYVFPIHRSGGGFKCLPPVWL